MEKRSRLLAVGVLCLLAGCKDVTYKYPTAKFDLKPPKEQTDTMAAAIAWQERFAEAAKSEMGGDFVVSPIAAWQSMLVFLNQSDGQTYDGLAANLGTVGDREKSTATTTKWLIEHKKSASPKIAHGVFMIWPIVPGAAAEQDSAQTFGADLVKIGSAGQGAEIAIRQWSTMRVGAPIQLYLTREIAIESISIYRDDSKQPYALQDITKVLRAMKVNLVEPGNKLDLRPLSIELDSRALPIRFTQHLSVAKPKTDPKSQWFEVRDPKSGQILLCGRN